MKAINKVTALLIIIAITALITWRATILYLQITVDGNTAYTNSFGYVDTFHIGAE